MRLAVAAHLESLVVGRMDAVLATRKSGRLEQSLLNPFDDRRGGDVFAEGYVFDLEFLLRVYRFIINHSDCSINQIKAVCQEGKSNLLKIVLLRLNRAIDQCLNHCKITVILGLTPETKMAMSEY